MQWHHGHVAPWIWQLQVDAERAHACIRERGRTVLDQARTNLNIKQASANNALCILQEMVRLIDSSIVFGMPAMQKQPEPMLPLPKVHIQTLSFPNYLASPKTLRPIWDLWQNSLKQYFGPLAKQPIPAWEAVRQHSDNWREWKDMLLELDAQVAFCDSNITKVKDRSMAVNHVLDQWHVKMETIESVREGQMQRSRNKLTVGQVGTCWRPETRRQKRGHRRRNGTD